jgi:hypothetical protein
MGLQAVPGELPPDEFRRQLESEHAMYSKLGKEMGISLK